MTVSCPTLAASDDRLPVAPGERLRTAMSHVRPYRVGVAIRKTRLVDIQALRAVAVLMVVAAHAGLPLPGGFAGVDVFFVISGFVVSRSVSREFARAGRLALRRFLARRARRLLPALGALVAAVAVGESLLGAPFGTQQAAAKTGLAASGFGANLELYKASTDYFGTNQNNVFLHLWSLSVEEQFYVGLVLTALLCGAIFSKRRVVRSTLISAIAVSLGAFYLLSSAAQTIGPVAAPQRLAFYSPFSRAWEFLLGCLVTDLFTRLAVSRALGRGLTTTGLALIGIAALRPIELGQILPYQASILAAVGAALAILGLDAGRTSPRPGTRALLFLGDRSYGWYLWHWPLIVLVRGFSSSTAATTVAAVAAVAPASLSFRFLEFPRRPLTRARIGLVLGAAGFSCLGLLIGASVAWGQNSLSSMASQLPPYHLDYVRQCDTNAKIDDSQVDRCTLNHGGSTTAYLVGDSNAGQFSEALAGGAKALHLTARVFTLHACPIIGVTPVTRDDDGNRCRRRATDVLAYLERQEPSVVILAAASTAYVNQRSVHLLGPGNQLASTPEAKARLWREALGATITELRRRGHRVVVVPVIPYFDWAPSTCSVLRDLLFGSCGEMLDLSTVEQGQRLSRDAEISAASDAGAQVWDLRPELCPGRICRTNSAANWVYKDGTHLTVGASKGLAPLFAKYLRDTIGHLA